MFGAWKGWILYDKESFRLILRKLKSVEITIDSPSIFMLKPQKEKAFTIIHNNFHNKLLRLYRIFNVIFGIEHFYWGEDNP